ncbi:hypothetical protein HPB49_008545 [Dermacentor silvarum]|uniref:Uncharacterized protein n=1 Tax=Dermacentor silvarum TaxID=543639 RepID=A0ACB8CE24_DERSI|nr:hypothetical protein HPB49_008545 [Dermacentor silvarum]
MGDLSDGESGFAPSGTPGRSRNMEALLRPTRRLLTHDLHPPALQSASQKVGTVGKKCALPSASGLHPDAGVRAPVYGPESASAAAPRDAASPPATSQSRPSLREAETTTGSPQHTELSSRAPRTRHQRSSSLTSISVDIPLSLSLGLRRREATAMRAAEIVDAWMAKRAAQEVSNTTTEPQHVTSATASLTQVPAEPLTATPGTASEPDPTELPEEEEGMDQSSCRKRSRDSDDDAGPAQPLGLSAHPECKRKAQTAPPNRDVNKAATEPKTAANNAVKVAAPGPDTATKKVYPANSAAAFLKEPRPPVSTHLATRKKGKGQQPGKPANSQPPNPAPSGTSSPPASPQQQPDPTDTAVNTQPADPPTTKSELVAKWLKNISRENLVVNDKSASTVVCSRHFLSTDYVPGCRIRKLLPGVVPTVFDEYPSYLVPSAKKPRKEI